MPSDSRRSAPGGRSSGGPTRNGPTRTGAPATGAPRGPGTPRGTGSGAPRSGGGRSGGARSGGARSAGGDWRGSAASGVRRVGRDGEQAWEPRGDDGAARPRGARPAAGGSGRTSGRNTGDRPAYGGGARGRPSSGGAARSAGERPSYGGTGSRGTSGGSSRSSGDRPAYGTSRGPRPGEGAGRPARTDRPARADGRPIASERPARGPRTGSGRAPGADRWTRDSGIAARPQGAGQGGRPRRDPRTDSGIDRDRPGARRDNRVAPRRIDKPLTAAERRAAEVRATREPREPRERAAPPPWEREQWLDDGPLRNAAEQAALRASAEIAADDRRRPRRASAELAPEVLDDLQRVAPPSKTARYQERLASAADALDRGRFDDARRMVQPVLRDVPDMAFGHEIAGLALYRVGQWRKAAAELEVARQLDGSLNHHPVLADCYRAMRRYHEVEQLWRELRDGSPSPALMAEGRIVAAGALADQGDLAGALKVMERAGDLPKRVRDYHLRQWYVLADLYDRSGDIIKARRYFGLVYEVDALFADVVDRLHALGR